MLDAVTRIGLPVVDAAQVEDHELGLFHDEDHRDAFRRAGLEDDIAPAVVPDRH